MKDNFVIIFLGGFSDCFILFCSLEYFCYYFFCKAKQATLFSVNHLEIPAV